MNDYPDLERLKAANESLRELGMEWIWASLEKICDDVNYDRGQPVEPNEALQVAIQDWQFDLDRNLMVGQRMGIRYKTRTLLVEVGWPRSPEHGIVPDLSLARARVSFSQNIMVDPLVIDELTLRRVKANDAAKWHLIAPNQSGQELSIEHLKGYVDRLLKSEEH